MNGQIEVDGEWLTIRRKGAVSKLSHGLKGDKRIALANVQAVQLKKPGLTNGYLQLTISGGKESGGGVFDATKDENSVMFTKRHMAEFEAVRDAIEAAVAARLRGGPTSSVDVADQIGKLAALRDQGILTDAEFTAQKRKLLDP